MATSFTPVLPALFPIVVAILLVLFAFLLFKSAFVLAPLLILTALLLVLTFPLLVRLETASAILLMPPLVPAVLLVAIMADLFVFVPAQSGRELTVRNMPPGSVVVRPPVPGIVPVEIIVVSEPKEVIGDIDRNIESESRREDELGRSRKDNRGDR
jgi:hypothetical protein